MLWPTEIISIYPASCCFCWAKGLDQLRTILAGPTEEKRQKDSPEYVLKCRHWYLSSVSHFHPDPRGLKTHNTENVKAAVLLSEIHVCWKRRPQAASINCISPCDLHQLTPGNKTKASRRESSPRYAPLLFTRQQELGHNCFVICHYLFSCSHKQMGNIPSAGSTL